MPNEWSGVSIRKQSEDHMKLLQPVLKKWIRLQKTFFAKDGSYIYADSEEANTSLLASAAWKTRDWSGVCEVPFYRLIDDDDRHGRLDLYLTYSGTEDQEHEDFLSYCIETKLIRHNGSVQRDGNLRSSHLAQINIARLQVRGVKESEFIQELPEKDRFRFLYGAFFTTFLTNTERRDAEENGHARKDIVAFVKANFDACAWLYPDTDEVPNLAGNPHIGVCLGLSDATREFAPGETS